MTREEAIEYLKRADVTVGREIKTKTAKALEMAIKALEQESTTKNNLEVDCIDRRELLKAMDTWDKFGDDPNKGLIPLRTPTLQDRYVPYVKYDDMINCVKGMPPVTPQEPILDKIRDEIEAKCCITVGRENDALKADEQQGENKNE